MSWIEPVPDKLGYELRVVTLTDRERRALISLIQKQRELPDSAAQLEPLTSVMQKLR